MLLHGREAPLVLASPWGNLSRGLVIVDVLSGDKEARDCRMAVSVHEVYVEQGHILVSLGLRQKKVLWSCQKEDSNYRTQEKSSTISVTRYFRRAHLKEFLLINTSIFTNYWNKAKAFLGYINRSQR